MTWIALGIFIIGLLVFFIRRSMSKAIQSDLREDEIDAAKKASDRRKHIDGLSRADRDKLYKQSQRD